MSTKTIRKIREQALRHSRSLNPQLSVNLEILESAESPPTYAELQIIYRPEASPFVPLLQFLFVPPALMFAKK